MTLWVLLATDVDPVPAAVEEGRRSEVRPGRKSPAVRADEHLAVAHGWIVANREIEIAGARGTADPRGAGERGVVEEAPA